MAYFYTFHTLLLTDYYDYIPNYPKLCLITVLVTLL